MQINEKHFQNLLRCVKEVSTASEKVKKGVWLGKSTKKWLQTAKRNYEKYEGDWDKEIDLDPMEFEDKSYDRYELRSLIHLTKLNSASCQEKFVRSCVANIFAWGGQGTRWARKSQKKEHWDNWKFTCFNLLDDKISAVNAYKDFHHLHNCGLMPAVGPAFYTKLIFFLGSGDGLIMDQWTSRSVNLLFNEEYIQLNRGAKKKSGDHYYYVKKENNYKVYEDYLLAVSLIANRLSSKLDQDISPSKAEEYIFSFTTDKKKTRAFLNEQEYFQATNWRRYVEEMHRPLKTAAP